MISLNIISLYLNRSMSFLIFLHSAYLIFTRIMARYLRLLLFIIDPSRWLKSSGCSQSISDEYNDRRDIERTFIVVSIL